MCEKERDHLVQSRDLGAQVDRIAPVFPLKMRDAGQRELRKNKHKVYKPPFISTLFVSTPSCFNRSANERHSSTLTTESAVPCTKMPGGKSESSTKLGKSFLVESDRASRLFCSVERLRRRSVSSGSPDSASRKVANLGR